MFSPVIGQLYFCLFVIGPLHLSEHALWRASGISFFITNCLLPSHWIWPWNVFTYCIIGPWDLWDLAEHALRRSSGISFFIASHWLRPECSYMLLVNEICAYYDWTTASGRIQYALRRSSGISFFIAQYLLASYWLRPDCSYLLLVNEIRSC